jgi:hypothetical protein
MKALLLLAVVLAALAHTPAPTPPAANIWVDSDGGSCVLSDTGRPCRPG